MVLFTYKKSILIFFFHITSHVPLHHQQQRHHTRELSNKIIRNKQCWTRTHTHTHTPTDLRAPEHRTKIWGGKGERFALQMNYYLIRLALFDRGVGFFHALIQQKRTKISRMKAKHPSDQGEPYGHENVEAWKIFMWVSYKKKSYRKCGGGPFLSHVWIAHASMQVAHQHVFESDDVDFQIPPLHQAQDTPYQNSDSTSSEACSFMQFYDFVAVVFFWLNRTH